MMKKVIYFGLGAISLTREKAEKMIQEMVEKGEMSKDEAKKFVDDSIKRGEEERQELRNIIKEELNDLKDLFAGSQSELENLKSKIKDLEGKLS